MGADSISNLRNNPGYKEPPSLGDVERELTEWIRKKCSGFPTQMQEGVDYKIFPAVYNANGQLEIFKIRIEAQTGALATEYVYVRKGRFLKWGVPQLPTIMEIQYNGDEVDYLYNLADYSFNKEKWISAS